MLRKTTAMLLAAAVAAPVGLAMATSDESSPSATAPSTSVPVKHAVKRLVLRGVLHDDADENMLILEVPRGKHSDERGQSRSRFVPIRLAERTRIRLEDGSDGTFEDLLAEDRVVVVVNARQRGGRRVLSPALAVIDLEPVEDQQAPEADPTAPADGEDATPQSSETTTAPKPPPVSANLVPYEFSGRITAIGQSPYTLTVALLGANPAARELFGQRTSVTVPIGSSTIFKHKDGVTGPIAVGNRVYVLIRSARIAPGAPLPAATAVVDAGTESVSPAQA